MYSTREKIMMMSAAALGVSVMAGAFAPHVQDALARDGFDFVNDTASQGLAPLDIDGLSQSKFSWEPHSEGDDKRSAKIIVNSAAGPVAFLINQSDEIASDYFDKNAIPLVDAPVVNSFSEKEIGALARSIDKFASTSTGQDILSHIAEETSGVVQIANAPDDVTYYGMARANERYLADGIKAPKDDTYDIVRIAFHARAISDEPIAVHNLGSDGRNLAATTDILLAHELGHTIGNDPKALHAHDENKFVPIDDAHGDIRDLAQNWERQYRNEVSGTSPEVIIYPSKSFQIPESSWSDSGQIEFAKTRATLERYAHLQSPGFAPDQIMPPSASSLGALKFDDAKFATHAQALAADVMRHTGGPVTDLGDKEAAKSNPHNTLNEASAWLQSQGGAKSDDAVVRRALHEVESAQRVATYRDEMASLSVYGVTKEDAYLDTAARRDPETAIKVFESDPSAASIATLRDMQREDGVYAHAKAFIADHNNARTSFAVAEDQHDRNTTSHLPGARLISSISHRGFESASLFEQGADKEKMVAVALTAQAQIENNNPIAKSNAQSVDVATTRRARSDNVR